MTKFGFSGYTADIVTDEDVTARSVEGICVGGYSCIHGYDTAVAALIAGRRTQGVRGLAYKAKIKPIDVFQRNQDGVDERELLLAIGQAGTSDINVVQNNYFRQGGLAGTYTGDDDRTYYYRNVTDTADISADERAKWAEIVAGTERIIVTPAGESGYNNENGRIELYHDEELENSVYSGVSYITTADIDDSLEKKYWFSLCTVTTCCASITRQISDRDCVK